MEKMNIRTIPEIAKEVNRLLHANIKTYQQVHDRIASDPRLDLSNFREEADRIHDTVMNYPKSEYATMSTPVRYERASHYMGIEAMMGPDFCATMKVCAEVGLPLGLLMEMAAQCGDDHVRHAARVLLTNNGGGAVNNGNMYASVFPIYQHYGEAATIQFDADLMRELQMTDLSSSVPAHMLEMPFRHVYIQFGPVGELNSVLNEEYIVRNRETGDHRLEGCLLSFHGENYRAYSSEARDALGFTDDMDIRSFDVMFIGSPKSNLMDDATHHVTIIYDHNSEEPLTDILRKSMDYYINTQKFDMRESYRNMHEEDGIIMTRNIDLLARCLVYMNCAECRRIDVDEKTPIEQHLRQVANPKKRRRIEKQLALADRYVLIKPVTRNDGFLPGETTGRHVRAHWRRGHMRMQPFGEGRTKRKLVHIRPTLIGADTIGQTPAKPTYKVK